MDDPLGAFCRHVDIRIEGASEGPLAGLTFAAKDIYDVAGQTCCFGNPDWLATHSPAESTSPVVTTLLDAGATLVGKTLTDELTFSLNGENHHYGTPVNSAAPERIPGGSSNGSASAVAGRLVDFALGSDTGGSVRAPASYCGLYGLRPSHGAISLQGVLPLAPSFDTAGWFARDADLLERVGDMLLPSGDAGAPGRLLYAADAFERCLPEARAPLRQAVEWISATLGPAEDVTVAKEGLDTWLHHFQALQFREIWQSHGDWITEHNPEFGPGIDERFRLASEMPDARVEPAKAFRIDVAERLGQMLGDNAILVLPTAPGAAPLKALPNDETVLYRNRALGILCISGLGRLPQLSIPVGISVSAPLGISLIAAPGGDRMLLAAARRLGAWPH